jgi:hypothetical protein
MERKTSAPKTVAFDNPASMNYSNAVEVHRNSSFKTAVKEDIFTKQRISMGS